MAMASHVPVKLEKWIKGIEGIWRTKLSSWRRRDTEVPCRENRTGCSFCVDSAPLRLRAWNVTFEARRHEYQTQLNARSADFQANAPAMKVVVEDLRHGRQDCLWRAGNGAAKASRTETAAA